MWQTNFPLPLLSRSRGKARSRNSSIQLLMVATRSWKSSHWLASCSLLPVKHSGYWKCLQTRTKRGGLFHSLRLRALVRHTCMPRTRRRPWLVHHVRFCPANRRHLRPRKNQPGLSDGQALLFHQICQRKVVGGRRPALLQMDDKIKNWS